MQSMDAYEMATLLRDAAKLLGDTGDTAGKLHAAADDLEEESERTRFRNYYTCPQCGESWSDDYSAACDSECACGVGDLSPVYSVDIESADLAEALQAMTAAVRKLPGDPFALGELATADSLATLALQGAGVPVDCGGES